MSAVCLWDMAILFQVYGSSAAFDSTTSIPDNIKQGDAIILNVKASITNPNFRMEMTAFSPQGFNVSLIGRDGFVRNSSLNKLGYVRHTHYL